MKLRKILSITLATVMLISIFSMNISAEEGGIVYSAVASHNLTANGSVSETLFSVDVEIDENKFTCFDGGNKEYSTEITSVVASYQVATFDGSVGEKLTADYLTDPEAFFALFAKQEEDRK